ncbi:NUDIX domain-containing protein [Streptomyces sp. NPDC005476]|uniref:NUDIX domain-containing protein n=1 Tax=Streptomyces sp. NPDC005476 TaxID=3156882 RepID=UPI0034557F8D
MEGCPSVKVKPVPTTALRSPTGQTHCSDDGPLAPSSFGREPAILIAVGEPLTRRFLRLTGQKSTNPDASVGGHLEAAVPLDRAVRREAEEETGVHISADQQEFGGLVRYHDPGSTDRITISSPPGQASGA